MVRFPMCILGHTQTLHALIMEPESSGVLQETDMNTHVPTTFTVLPLRHESHTKVTIRTELKSRGLVEGFVAKLRLQYIYAQEIGLFAEIAEKSKKAVSPFEKTTLSRSSQSETPRR